MNELTEDEQRDAVKEAKILQALAHPNIVKFKEVYRTRRGKLWIVMEYAGGGDLKTRINAQRGRPFREAQIIDWISQIALALKHLHDRKVLHRDIKAQNIFLTENGRVKLGDFGISKTLDSTRSSA
jgi:NIMA (never in mitosis gene a)-related kinase